MKIRGNIVFLYWGRRGFSDYALEIARFAADHPHLNAHLCVSANNELADEFARISGAKVYMFPTFTSNVGAVYGLPSFFLRLRKLLIKWRRDDVSAVVILMPHVWTPILGQFLRRNRIKYGIVIHDAEPHPGDITALINPWLQWDIKRADMLFVLSQSVKNALIKKRGSDPSRIKKLFLPVIYQKHEITLRKSPSPLRVLFFGRIIAYKGLPLLVEAVELLRGLGCNLSLGVIGEGSLTELMPRLKALNADIINRWIEHKEIGSFISGFDIIVAPYIEASQSGVIASAFSAGKPVIVTPVGGLIEQVEHGVTGLIATHPTAAAIAQCIKRIADDDVLYQTMVAAITSRNEENSIERFVREIITQINDVPA